MKKRKPLGLVFVAIIVSVAAVAAMVLWWQSRPQGSPVAGEFTEVVLSERMTSARVLALGEATHGTHEFQALRLQLLQKVADQGFTTVAWEEDFGSVALVDAWLQGGPGTAVEAARLFGYGLNRTRDTVDLLTWVRAQNDQHPAGEDIRFVGIDAARPTATKGLALAWLAARNPTAAADLTARLARFTDESLWDRAVAADVESAVADLQAALTASDDGSEAAAEARQAGRVLEQARQRGLGVGNRDAMMFDNLAWVVERGTASGRERTLLFGHNGHLDRAGQATAVGGDTVGRLAARQWGDDYRVIGTDGHRVGLNSQGTVSTLTVNGRIRGLFEGTTVGYLELASVTGADAELLRGATTMVSAGEPFASWQAWVPPLHTVSVTPAEAWDALIYVWDASPTERLG